MRTERNILVSSTVKISESHHKNFPSYSAVSNSSRQQWLRWFINPSADILYWYIHFTFLYLNCFLHAVICFVHCALSLIILFYIFSCCDTRCFKKCLFILVCRRKSPTGLMLHKSLTGLMLHKSFMSMSNFSLSSLVFKIIWDSSREK